ncbi:DUF389 domain-containing protein [Pseudarthrobacter sp. J1763]|uniref:DUF389 domain-containing protein n=1 Tax=Pseudarthrobacter sp. J1763 TaxID=3420445 RepID=UPI003D2C6016
MTIQLRIAAPESLSDSIVRECRSFAGTAGLSVSSGASLIPAGDVITVLIPREAADRLLQRLHAMGVPELGAVTITEPELVLSKRADKVEKRVPGEGVDAVIWDEVEGSLGEDSRLSWSYLVFLIIALQLAGIGIVTNSTIAVVGAMVVGPEFGPLAALAMGLIERRMTLVRNAVVALALGFPLAMLVTAAATWISRPWGIYSPDALSQGSAVEFIYHPGPYSFIVAVLAGAAGMMSLIGRKSSALVGVFISVTTVPAAGFAAVALVLGDAPKAGASAIQLALNLAGIVISGIVVLLFHRFVRAHKTPRSPK